MSWSSCPVSWQPLFIPYSCSFTLARQISNPRQCHLCPFYPKITCSAWALLIFNQVNSNTRHPVTPLALLLRDLLPLLSILCCLSAHSQTWVYSFIDQIFIPCFLCAGHCTSTFTKASPYLPASWYALPRASIIITLDHKTRDMETASKYQLQFVSVSTDRGMLLY